MMWTGRRAGLAMIVLFWLVSFGAAEARDEPAPVIEAATQPGISAQKAAELENRISVLERQVDNQALLQLVERLENLRSEMQSILSQVEEQGYQVEGIQKRQRDLYLDIDQRLRKLEEARSAPSSGAAISSAPPAAATSPSAPAMATPTPPSPVGSSAPAAPAAQDMSEAEQQLERKAYEQAFTLLKDGKYDDAIAAFKAFVQTYPDGRYAANAQYWLGEANYVQRRFNDALAEFNKVLKNFPHSSKRSDAMLKLGYTYQELGDFEQARVMLNNLIQEFPSSTAANLAKKRLQDFKQLQ